MGGFSLSYRIAAVIVILQTFILLVAIWQNVSRTTRAIQEQLDTVDRIRMDGLAELARDAFITGEYDGLMAVLRSLKGDRRIMSAHVGDRGGRVVASVDPLLLGRPAPPREPGALWHWRTTPVMVASQAIGEVAVRFSDADLVATRMAAWRQAGAVGGAGLLATIAVSLLLGRFLTRRLDHLVVVTQQLAAGNVQARARLGGRDEIARLGAAFDRMAGALQERDTARRQAEEARQKLEAQLRQAQKMEALGTLAGGIAHDFNNMLAAIIGNVELVRQDIGPDHAALGSLAEIGKASTRARDLVLQILTFSRQQPQERRVIALREVTEESVKLLRSSLPAGIELVTAFAPKLPNVLADRTQIHQVLMNLCGNAWHAMQGESGRIEVALAEVIANGDRPHPNLRPGRYARLTVSDTGKGMDPATVERIFDPFFTTKPPGEGTGLGLAVVDGIVKSHDGEIAVHSEPGRGTVFHLYFPATEAGAEVLLRAPANLSRGSGQRILYIDDEEALVRLAEKLLGRLGYRIKVFTCAAEALAAFRADPAAFDLVVTDLNMPGTSGLEVAAEILRLRPDALVALTSGYVTQELSAKARALGICEVIYKPNTVDDLIEAIHRMLGKMAQPAQAEPGGSALN